MLVGISGDINSGKDLVGKMFQYLTSEYRDMYGFEHWLNRMEMYGSNPHSPIEIKKFAEKLKEIVCILLNCTREQLEDREFKNKELGEEWWYYKSTHVTDLGRLVQYQGNLSKATSQYWTVIKLTPRLLMQLMGTECGRNIIHPNVWVNATMGEFIPGKSNWALTDTRFPNEGNAIYQRNGIVLRLERPETDIKDRSNLHESETALDLFKFTGILKNTKDLPYLLDQVKEYV
jgi:hypothetical protein